MYLDFDPMTPGAHPNFAGAVEIEIWEGYLSGNKTNLVKTLCTYSIDDGPVRETIEQGLVFRFTAFDWHRNIRDLMVRNNICFEKLGESRMDDLRHLLGKKIYIAEDDPDILFSLSTMLEDAGYRVRGSSRATPILNGDHASVDLFILDKQMPDGDGLEVCRYLRAQATTRDTPVILISAHARLADEALHAGASDYIEKPFEMHYLLNVVSKFVNRPREK